MGFLRSKLHFQKDLPAPKSLGSDTLVIFDRILLKRIPGFSSWVRGFSRSYAVTAGEELKDLSCFPGHVERILDLTNDFSPRKTVIVVVGGGSVGDFGGFVASILKRGVRLVHLPSTWLSAIDSAHGGKTALNVRGIKNQVGTFHPASDIYLVRNLLLSQPPARAQDGFGELAKIALIDGGSWNLALARSNERGGELIWKFLPQAIRAKYRIVDQDPLEKNGIRQLLNLGHTLGHVLETHLGLSHGAAVAQGLFFSLEWSRKRDLLDRKTHAEIRSLLKEKFAFHSLAAERRHRKLSRSTFLSLIGKDKKRSSVSEISFIFLRGPGKAIALPVSLNSIASEAKAQGWIG